MGIEWRPVFSYENVYSVSEYGNVWSCRSKLILKPHLHKSGHLYVGLRWKGSITTYPVHRIVAAAYHGFDPALVRHLDGDKYNLHWSNLKYGTHEENQADRVRHRAELAGALLGPTIDQLSLVH